MRSGLLAATAVALLAAGGRAAVLGGEAHAQAAAMPGQVIAFNRAKGNCLACHTMRGGDVPSNVGPELADMKTRFPKRADLYAVVYDEGTRNPQTVMPPFGKNRILSEQEINAVVDFLYSL